MSSAAVVLDSAARAQLPASVPLFTSEWSSGGHVNVAPCESCIQLDAAGPTNSCRTDGPLQSTHSAAQHVLPTFRVVGGRSLRQHLTIERPQHSCQIRRPIQIGVHPGVWGGIDPLNICRRGQSMFLPLKCHILLFETVVGCQQWKAKPKVA